MHTIRHCPRCGSDYRPEIERCGECGGALESRTEGEDPRWWPVSEGDGLGRHATVDADPVTIFTVEDVRELEEPARRLTDRGIPFRIASTTAGFRMPRTHYDLQVSERHRDEALQELGTPGHGGPAGAAEFDPERGYRICPACGARLSEGAPSCPDCDLALRGFPGEEA